MYLLLGQVLLEEVLVRHSEKYLSLRSMVDHHPAHIQEALSLGVIHEVASPDLVQQSCIHCDSCGCKFGHSKSLDRVGDSTLVRLIKKRICLTLKITQSEGIF